MLNRRTIVVIGPPKIGISSLIRKAFGVLLHEELASSYTVACDINSEEWIITIFENNVSQKADGYLLCCDTSNVSTIDWLKPYTRLPNSSVIGIGSAGNVQIAFQTICAELFGRVLSIVQLDDEASCRGAFNEVLQKTGFPVGTNCFNTVRETWEYESKRSLYDHQTPRNSLPAVPASPLEPLMHSCFQDQYLSSRYYRVESPSPELPPPKPGARSRVEGVQRAKSPQPGYRLFPPEPPYTGTSRTKTDVPSTQSRKPLPLLPPTPPPSPEIKHLRQLPSKPNIHYQKNLLVAENRATTGNRYLDVEDSSERSLFPTSPVSVHRKSDKAKCPYRKLKLWARHVSKSHNK